MKRPGLKKRPSFGRRKPVGPTKEPAELNDLLEAAQQAFITVDGGRTVVKANKAAEVLLGYGPGEIDHRPLTEIFPCADSDPLVQIPLFPQAPEERTFRLRDGGSMAAEVSRVPRPGLGKDSFTLLLQDNGMRRYFTRVLMENEQRLFQFLEILPVGIFILNEMGLPYYCNQTAKDILGQGLHPRVPIEKLCETYGFFRASSNQAYPTEKHPLWLALKGERSNVEDVELRSPDRVVPLEIWGAPILNEKGGVKFATMVFVDISARHLSQNALRDSEEKFHALADRATDAVVLCDEGNRIVYFNKGAEDLFGYPQVEVLGQPFAFLLPDRLKRIFRDAREGSTDPGLPGPRAEWNGRRKDGSEVPLEVSSSRWSTVKGSFTTRILRDISQRKQAERLLQEREETFRNLFEEGPIGMALVDDQGRVLKINQAFCQLLGRRKRDLVGSPYSDLMEPEDRSVDESLAGRLFNKTLPQYQLEQRYLTAQGRALWCKLTASVALDVEGNPLHRLVIVENIDELKQIEEMKNDLIAVASHQLKTPVAEINGYIQILLEEMCGPLTKKQRTFLTDMLEIGRENFRLIGDLLNASKLERGVVSMDIERIELRCIAESSIRDYESKILEKGLELRMLGMDKVIWVKADKNKTAEALRNIINNAIKCTDRGSLTLEIEAVDGMGRVRVTDTGIGMNAETLGRLFTKSRVLGKEAGRAGAGLGLFIAKSFLQLQQGDIEVTSTPGVGTCFTLKLPLNEGEQGVGHESKG